MEAHGFAYRGPEHDDADLEAPQCPPRLAYLLIHFCELNASERTFGAYAPQPITASQRAAWIAERGISLDRDELALIARLDSAWRSAWSEHMRRTNPRR